MALAQNLPEELEWVCIERLADGDELRNVDLTLMTLDHPDDRVRSLEARCELPLRDVSLLPSPGEYVGDRGSGRASKGLHDAVRSD